MSRLSETLAAGRFAVTAELHPPKGTDVAPLLSKAESLRGHVTALNVTDSPNSRMCMSGLAVARLLVERGLEPVLQLTCRDRNRIALQADLLGASALGVANLLCMGGDPPDRGDHPDAKAVFDLNAVGLLGAVDALSSGRDLAGKTLQGTPSFSPGAVANPGAPVLEEEIARMEQKVQAGARFFQTQAVYDPAGFERFMGAAARLGVPILAGLIMVKSAEMARFLNANLPGVRVPEAVIREMARATDRRAASTAIAGRIIGAIRPMCQGVHLMAIGWESLIPGVLEAAGVE